MARMTLSLLLLCIILVCTAVSLQAIAEEPPAVGSDSPTEPPKAPPEESTAIPGTSTVIPAEKTAEDKKAETETGPEGVKPEGEKEATEESQQTAEPEKKQAEAGVSSTEVPSAPRRFGYDFFSGVRKRILKLEATGAAVTPPIARDAISGFVGPVDMMGANVSATVPSKYVLGPGDSLTVHYWSDVTEFQTMSLTVDDKGEVTVPKIGKIVARGMTLAQFQEAAQEIMARATYRNLKLIATLDKLRSIQIFITGEAFRPGSYAVSAVSTLFNALYMCGGPSDNGSLRDIKLLRNNETKPVDFYSFLVDGDSSHDYNLDAGDTIFIAQAGRTATISGEVRRPSIYELNEGENLLELISLAGGIRPGGFLQRVQIDSVDPGRERILIDVDLSVTKQPNPPIFDGDTVKVFSIPSERMNTVTIEGKVKMPGIYQLKDGMTVSDLIRAAQWVLGEAHTERADLFRLNPDKKTTKLIPINLAKALAGDVGDNVRLEQWDKLVVYSKWDVQWIADRAVNVRGAVQRPDTYERSDGMTINDLLLQAGGTLPEAYTDRAFLMRLDERRELTKIVPVNLKGSDVEIKLEDGDTLLVYTYKESRWEPKREVTVEGAVQSPGSFPRVDGMKVSDLIQRAGGLLPTAYPDRALLLRLDERQRITQGFFINPRLAVQNDPRDNLELRDGDQLKVYTYQEAAWESKREVTVAGAVNAPSVFQRVDGMRASDLLRRAGGLLPNAYLERADIKRFRPDHETYMAIPVNLAKVLSGDREADLLLQDEDVLTVYTLREAEYKPKNIVTVYGAVQRPDIFTRTEGMKLSDLLFVAGGTLPSVYKDIEVARTLDSGEISIITVNLTALKGGDASQDILLEDEDVVSIRRQGQFPDVLPMVTLAGEVKSPGTYVIRPNERLSSLIKRAGGLAETALPEASVIKRKIEHIILEEQKSDIQQLGTVINDINQQRYQREVAAARLIEERAQTGREKEGIGSTITTAPSIGPVVTALQTAAESSPATSIPGQTEATVSGLEGITEGRYTLVTPARKMDEFPLSERLVLDLRKALERPGGEDDIVLKDGDMITIPVGSDSVLVTGAVFKQLSHVYVKGMKIKDYIQMAGGYSIDADTSAVYVVRVDGNVVKGEDTKLAKGDVIVVPTKVMVQKVTDRWGQVIGVIKFVATTLATVYAIKLILK